MSSEPVGFSYTIGVVHRDAGPGWQPMATAPKDGTDILICMPGAMSDHYYVVCWEPGLSLWECRWCEEMRLTEEQIAHCHTPPMWMDLPMHPGSLEAMP